ncbi:MAG: hypothetical protein WCH46_11405, partial [bacterium]
GGGYDGTTTFGNTASGNASTISGGFNLLASGAYSSIGGGQDNQATGPFHASVGGGFANKATGQASAISGGSSNTASAPGAFVGGGGYDGTTTAGNTASGNAATVGGGLNNGALGNYSTIAGGINNGVSLPALRAFIGGGTNNQITNQFGVIAGGIDNIVGGNRAAVLGGGTNHANGDYTAILGGRGMQLDGSRALGFNANDGILTRDMTIAAADVAVIANADVWLANNRNQASALDFYAPYNTSGAFPNGTKFVGFKAGVVTTSVTWVLPLADAAGVWKSDGASNLSIAKILPADFSPGANNTFLTTNNGGTVGWNGLNVDGVTLQGNGSGTALAINLATSNTWTNTEIFQQLNPRVDVSYELGTTALRWKELYLGPSSLHLYATAAEAGSIRDWSEGISPTGSFVIKEATAGTTPLTITPAGAVTVATGLTVSTGVTMLSYATIAAGAAIVIPTTSSVIEITNDAAAAANLITMPAVIAADNGRIIYIHNGDLQATTGTVIASGATATFVVSGAAWQRVGP